MPFLCSELSLLPHLTYSKSQSLYGQLQGPIWLTIPFSPPPPLLSSNHTGPLVLLEHTACSCLLALGALSPDNHMANSIMSFESVLNDYLFGEDYYDHHMLIHRSYPSPFIS